MRNATTDAFINRIVSGARLPSRADREDLRRELWTHFESAEESLEGRPDAMQRFGAEEAIVASLRRVYRWDYVLFYSAKVAAALVASLAAAFLIQILVNIRLQGDAALWRLAPGFWNAMAVSSAIVFGLIMAWEIDRRPFNGRRAAIVLSGYVLVCAVVQVLSGRSAPLFTATALVGLGYLCWKLKRWVDRLLLTLGAYALALYSTHAALSVSFGPTRALLAGGIYVAVCASTALIQARIHGIFANRLDT